LTASSALSAVSGSRGASDTGLSSSSHP